MLTMFDSVFIHVLRVNHVMLILMLCT